MKTRIIQTRFYKDSDVQKLSLYGQHLFLYLLTCEHINMSGIFELPDSYIMLEAKLTENQLATAKKELTTMGKVLFCDGWIKVINAEKNNNYRNSPKNEVAYQKELQRVPQRVLQILNTSIDTTINTTTDTTMHSSHKSKIINQKPKKEESVRETKTEIPGFEEFWEVYPRREGRGKAEESYAKALTLTTHEVILQAIKDQAPEILKKEKQYRPLPTTWLNQKRWLDELKERPKKQKRVEPQLDELAEQIESPELTAARQHYRKYLEAAMDSKFGKGNWTLTKLWTNLELKNKIDAKYAEVYPDEHKVMYGDNDDSEAITESNFEVELAVT